MNNIPKIIHYCWFGKNEMPKKTKKLIEQWKKELDDYEFIEWNEEKFNVESSNEFVKKAYSLKKWAFVADFVRLYALKNYGGIYLDTDVQILKKFDDLLNEHLFLSYESDITVCTAVIGAEKENKVVCDFLYTYENKIVSDDSIDMTPNSELLFQHLNKYDEKVMNLNEIKNELFHIYPFEYFCAKDIHNYKIKKTNNTYTIHHLDATWYSPKKKILRKCKSVVMSILNIFRK